MSHTKFFLFVFIPMLLAVFVIQYGDPVLHTWAGSKREATVFVVIGVYGLFTAIQLISLRTMFRELSEKE